MKLINMKKQTKKQLDIEIHTNKQKHKKRNVSSSPLFQVTVKCCVTNQTKKNKKNIWKHTPQALVTVCLNKIVKSSVRPLKKKKIQKEKQKKITDNINI